MLKLIKYLWFASIIKKIQHDLMSVLTSTILLALTAYISSDLINITTGTTVYSLLLIKWTIIIVLSAYIINKIINMVKKGLNPLTREHTKTNQPQTTRPIPKGNNTLKKPPVKPRYYKLLKKDTLKTSTDLVIQKYTKNKTQHPHHKTCKTQ